MKTADLHSSRVALLATTAIVAIYLSTMSAYGQVANYTGTQTATGPFLSGTQNFRDDSMLSASHTNAVSGGTQTFYDNSRLNLDAHQGLTSNTRIEFDNSSGGTGGTFALNGFNSSVGSIKSLNAGSGAIVNDGASDSRLTIDQSAFGPTVFSGTISDGSGAGALALQFSGGTLTLQEPPRIPAAPPSLAAHFSWAIQQAPARLVVQSMF